MKDIEIVGILEHEVDTAGQDWNPHLRHFTGHEQTLYRQLKIVSKHLAILLKWMLTLM